MSREIFRKYTDAETFSRIVDYDSVAEMWQASARSYADSVAIVDGEEYTYAALDALVASKRGELAARGIARCHPCAKQRRLRYRLPRSRNARHALDPYARAPSV